MKKYRKKPIIVEAARWDGNKIDDIYPITFFRLHGVDWHYSKRNLVIHTLEGEMTCQVGDYIVRGIKNELYVVKSDIFHELYDEVVE